MISLISAPESKNQKCEKNGNVMLTRRPDTRLIAREMTNYLTSSSFAGTVAAPGMDRVTELARVLREIYAPRNADVAVSPGDIAAVMGRDVVAHVEDCLFRQPDLFDVIRTNGIYPRGVLAVLSSIAEDDPELARDLSEAYGILVREIVEESPWITTPNSFRTRA